MPDNTVTGFGQQSAAPAAAPYNGDYYSMMPASHDYLSGNDMLSSTNANVVGQSAPGTAMPVISSGDASSKLPTGVGTNGIKMVEQGIQNLGLGVTSIAADPTKQPVQQNVTLPLAGAGGGSSASSQSIILPGSSMPVELGQSGTVSSGSNTMPGSNAPKPVSWAAIASKPAKPQPKPKSKPAGQGLPPPIKHNMDIGTWDGGLPSANKGPVRGAMPDQSSAPQRWSAPRQGGGSRYGSVIIYIVE